MIVLSLSKCSASLRGDLTKWLMEIDTGVYVGRVSARVRDHLWKKVENNIGEGRAILVFSAQNEQGFDIKTINSERYPIDCDGLKLMMIPAKEPLKERKIHQTRIKKASSNPTTKYPANSYVVLDIETTGLDKTSDRIIEFACLSVSREEITKELHGFIKHEQPLSDMIVNLTGITDEMINGGMDEKRALTDILDFIGQESIVIHNAEFDIGFLNAALLRHNMPLLSNVCVDTLKMARRRVKDVENYKLDTLIKRFSLTARKKHRALSDCHITYELYKRLIEIV